MTAVNNEKNDVLEELKEYERLLSKRSDCWFALYEMTYIDLDVYGDFGQKDLSAKVPVLPGIGILGSSEYDGISTQVYTPSANMAVGDILIKILILINVPSVFFLIKGIGWLLWLAATAALIYLFFIKKITIVKASNQTAKAKVNEFESFNYQAARQNFIDDCQAYDVAFSEIPKKFEEHISWQNENAPKAHDDYIRMNAEVDEFLKHTKYLKKDTAQYERQVAEYLKNGRASDYKEALNLAIEEKRKEEEEECRRAEAERQEELLRQQNRALGISEYGYRIR